MGCSKSSSKREVYSSTILPQETRKTLNRQPNFMPKQLEKEEEEQQQNSQNQQKERNDKDQSTDNLKRNEGGKKKKK